MTKNCQPCENKLRRTRRELGEAQDTLQSIKGLAQGGNESAAKEMSGGNVPQGRYGYLKGQHDAHTAILKLLGVKASAPTKRTRSKLFQGFGRVLR